MANTPVEQLVVKYTGAGNVEVFPLVGGVATGIKDGSDVGTGGPALAILEVGPAGNFAHNRVVEFLNDRYVLVMGTPPNTSGGVYKKNQGGAGQWSQVQDPFNAPKHPGSCSGLHVLHPSGVPTLAYLYYSNAHDFYMARTTDGLTGSDWTGDTQIDASALTGPASAGHSVVFGDSIFFSHAYYTGGAAGVGAITQYNFATDITTRYDPSSVFRAGTACELAFHVYDKVLFAINRGPAANSIRLAKLSGGLWVEVHSATGLSVGGGGSAGHHALFTDTATGDLISLVSGSTQSQCWRFTNPGGSVTALQISSTVMGATEGADKYLLGGGAASTDRRFSIFVDIATVPGTARTFITTWIPGGTTETWEWKGVAAEMELVGAGAGISDDFALPYDTVGGGYRSPSTSRISIGDTANSPVAVLGGTKFFFRGQGISGAGIITFRGIDTQGTPGVVIPIVAASLVIESGAPSTTPAISGNTITNFTPDSGATLYSVILDVSFAGVDITEGDIGLIIAELV